MSARPSVARAAVLSRAAGAVALTALSALAAPSARWPPVRCPSLRCEGEADGSRDSVAALWEELEERRDAADSALVLRLAEDGTPAAARALVESYELFSTLHLRRAVVRGLARFDGVPGAEAPALEKLVNVAVSSSSRALRKEAVAALAGCLRAGKAYLAQVVESAACDEVREWALAYHVAEPRAEDAEWYRELWKPPAPSTPDGGEGGGDAGGRPRGRPLEALRELAFGALVPELSTHEVRGALRDANHGVRRLALRELAWREADGLEAAAAEMYASSREWPANRALAAEILVERRGDEARRLLLRDAAAADVPPGLRLALAPLVAELRDEPSERRLVELLRRSTAGVRLFALRALRGREDPSLATRVRGLLHDDDPLVRAEAARWLAASGDGRAPAWLESAFERERDRTAAGALLGALAELFDGEPAWQERLRALARSPVEAVRNGALRQLGATGDLRHAELLAEGLRHPSWSTRLAALEALEELRSEYAVGCIVLGLERQHGRLAHEFSEALWRLTGLDLGTDAAAWRRWWVEELGRFRIPSRAELAEIQGAARARRERERTRSDFFGIRVDSHRVAFLIDTSGSMSEPTRGRYADEPGPPRIAVAVAELRSCLASLDRRAWFNVIAFDDDVRPWKRHAVELSSLHLAAADAHLARLSASGGTDLFGALSAALDDPEIDTLYVLSDGEPAAAPVTDPELIRQRVAAQNAQRGVVIHCVAVGGQLALLEWLAEDSGGTCVRVP